jgi:outer membrane protein assembly factor BamE (lipoprotein component of BamABCDE complex)
VIQETAFPLKYRRWRSYRMDARPLIASTFLALFALSGCGDYRVVKPGQSDMERVRLAMGRPTDIRFSETGEEIWEYAKAPMGQQTYVVRFEKDGVVKRVDQVLTAETIDRIAVGRSTKPEVRDLLGRPGDVSFFNGREHWEWPIRDTGMRTATLAVQFGDDGVVRSVGRVLDLRDGGKDQGDQGGSGSK